MAKKEELSLEKLIQETQLYDNPLTDKQKDILLAAEKLFSESGYSDTPTAEIAKKANVTEKTLFKHFPTKADLLKRIMFPLLLRVVVPTQIKHMKTLISKSGTNPQEIFKAVLRDRLQLANQLKGKLKFVLQELLKNDELREQVAKIWHDQLWVEVVKMIEVMKKEGHIRKDIKSEIVARSFVSLAVSYLISSQLFPNKWDHEENIEQLSQVLVKGIC